VGSHRAPPTPGRTWRRAADLTREVLLTVAAIFGAVCGLVIVLVVTLDLGVIVFRTGSMSPTIPTGSAAIVRTLPADQVAVGDVVTVPSPLGPLPVTHRVTSVEALPDGQTRLHLRGDANDAEDPFPYDVTEVRRVVAHAPGVGFALVRLDDPIVMGGVTVLVAGLILWALWPARGPEPSARELQPTSALLVLVAVAALTLGPTAAPAQAVGVPEPQPSATAPPAGGYPQADGVLALSSSLPPGADWSLSPGSDLPWRVTSAALPPAGADGAKGWLWVSLVAGGALVEQDDAVRLTLELCDAWALDGSCPAGRRDLPVPIEEGVVWLDRVPVGELTTERAQQVVVRIEVADALPDSAQGLDMYLGLRFDAFGDSVTIGEGGEVPGEPGGGEPGGGGPDSGGPGGGDPGPGGTDGAGGPGAVGGSGDASTAADPGGLGITGSELRPATWAVAALLIGTVLFTLGRDRRAARRSGAAGARHIDGHAARTEDGS
jgi:signal peptidase I